MDDLRLPGDLQHLWKSRKITKEEVEPMMTNVLREARNFRMRRRSLDIALLVLYALLLPLTFLVVLIARDYFGEPMVALGYAVWSVILVCGLLGYGLFYRSFRDQPSHDADSRGYIGQSIEYLNRRQRFLTKSAICCECLAGAGRRCVCVSPSPGTGCAFSRYRFVRRPAPADVGCSQDGARL